jgi:hypothetical protein
MLGWPAKPISADGVKMRTLAVWRGSSGGSTKVVSLRLNSPARACIVAVSRLLASAKTASGLPPKRRSVNTSRVTNS